MGVYLCFRRNPGQLKPEDGALPDHAVRAVMRVVVLQDAAADIQPQPAADHGAAVVLPAAVIPVPDIGKLLRGDAFPAVLDPDPDAVPARVLPDPYVENKNL